MEKGYTDELIFRALGDRHRLEILSHLVENEMNAGEILATVDVVQSTLSHHMKILTSSGLVNSRREGKCTYYTINIEAVEFVRESLKHFLESAAPAAPVTGADEKPEKKTPEKPEKKTPDRPEQKTPVKEKTEILEKHEDIATPINYAGSAKAAAADPVTKETEESAGNGKQNGKKDKKGKGKNKEKDKEKKSKSGSKKKKS